MEITDYTEIPDLHYVQPEDNVRLLDMYLPKTSEPYPVFIYFHGGGLENGSRKEKSSSSIKNLAECGIGLITADYRMYPHAAFPDFIQDAAAAVAFTIKYGEEHGLFNKIYIGGSSAGAHLSMQLCFNRRYFTEAGIDFRKINGYVFDSGQPTVHLNVLRERGLDTRRICVDEAAPLYYLDETFTNCGHQPEMLFIIAENDLPCRYEQNQVMIKTLEYLGYDMSKTIFRLMKGFSHCGYLASQDPDGSWIWADIIESFIRKGAIDTHEADH